MTPRVLASSNPMAAARTSSPISPKSRATDSRLSRKTRRSSSKPRMAPRASKPCRSSRSPEPHRFAATMHQRTAAFRLPFSFRKTGVRDQFNPMKQLADTPISVLDLATYSQGGTIVQAFETSRQLAQAAERWGYKRHWVAEHHNLEGVASAATVVLMGYLADHTKTIRIGSGGIMLPNHAPLVGAEEIGTLESLHPGRIDLGLGRAPGTDQLTMRALRRGGRGEEFDVQVAELLSYFAPAQPHQAVKAIPGAGIDVPLWILGSSLWSAHFAAAIGRPYAFASHFAPGDLLEAIDIYRREFKPSKQLAKPYVMVGVPAL